MLGPYIAAFLFGGILLAISLMAGGHDDADGGDHGDADADAHADGEVDAHADHGHDSGGKDVAAGTGFLSTFASLRFWTFFLAFGGGAGIAFTLLGLPSIVTAIAAGMMGAVSGGFAAWAFRTLGRKDLSSSLSADDWIGRTGKVTVPVSPDRPGKIFLSFENEVKELVALSAGAADGSIGVGEEVIVVSMADGVAKVTLNRPDARSDEKPLAAKVAATSKGRDA